MMVPDAAKTYAILGADLALTRYTGASGAAPLDAADSWGTLDLRVTPGGRGGLLLPQDPVDLAGVAGRENLAQALVLRLLTMRGALAPLGHPEYGSRLLELIGRVDNETTRNLARLHTIEALAQERRVRKLIDLAVEPAPGRADTIQIHLSVLPVADDDPLAVAFEVTL
jgi:phage baseplate assembly protein W